MTRQRYEIWVARANEDYSTYQFYEPGVTEEEVRQDVTDNFERVSPEDLIVEKVGEVEADFDVTEEEDSANNLAFDLREEWSRRVKNFVSVTLAYLDGIIDQARKGYEETKGSYEGAYLDTLEAVRKYIQEHAPKGTVGK